MEGAVESRKRHRIFSIASSRAAPTHDVSLRKSSSSFSVLSSSSKALSSKIGRHRSYTVSDTMLEVMSQYWLRLMQEGVMMAAVTYSVQGSYGVGCLDTDCSE